MQRRMTGVTQWRGRRNGFVAQQGFRNGVMLQPYPYWLDR